MSFKTDIEAMLGGSMGTVTDVQLANYLDQGVVDVVTKTIAKSPEKAHWFSRVYSTTGNVGIPVNLPIFDVTLGGVYCPEISLQEASKKNDPNSINYRTEENPCYYIKEGKIWVFPFPSSDLGTSVSTFTSTSDGVKVTISGTHNVSPGTYLTFSGAKYTGGNDVPQLNDVLRVKIIEDSSSFIVDLAWETGFGSLSATGAYFGFEALVTQVGYDTNINVGDSDLLYMPKERQLLVTKYAAFQSIRQNMANISTPDDITFPLEPASPELPNFSDIGDISYTANSMITAEGTAGTSGADVTTTDADWDDMLKQLTPPSYSGPVVFPDFTKAQTYLDDDDVELTASKLAIIREEVNEYQASIQNALNKFNKENTEYQAKVASRLQWYQAIASKSVGQKPFSAQLDGAAGASAQTNIAEKQMKLQKESQEYANKLSKYQTDIGNYQAKVASLVQESSEKLQRKSAEYQWLASEFTSMKQEYMESI